MIIKYNKENIDLDTRLWMQAESWEVVQALIRYLLSNIKAFSLSSSKLYSHLVRDEDGYLYDEITCEKQEVILELKNDSILLDGMICIGGLGFIEWQAIEI